MIQERRDKYVRTYGLARDTVFSEWQMREIHNTWMADHKSWMNEQKIKEYESWADSTGKGHHQKGHLKRKSAFAAYLFQILGNRHIVLASIRYPICSVAQPAAIVDEFMKAWEKQKTSEDYKKTVEISRPKTPERQVLKSRAHAARQNLGRGRKISQEVDFNWGHWHNLTDEDKNLFNDYKSGALQRRCVEADAACGDRRASCRERVSSPV